MTEFVTFRVNSCTRCRDWGKYETHAEHGLYLVPEPAGLARSDWAVRACTQAEAVEFIEAVHYAGGAPNTSVARHALVAVDAPGRIRGVALWLPPTRNAALSVDRENPSGVLALSRLCIDEDVPKNGASFLLGRSMRALDARWATLLTYADTRHGHTGAIYRATNWQYVGLMPGSDAWRAPDGSQRGRKRGRRNITVAELIDAGYTRLPASPKHKFVYRRGRTS
jgi:hypothetical protein